MNKWPRQRSKTCCEGKRSNVPDQTEKEEAESHENAPVENLADDDEIKRRKKSVSS